MKRRKGFYYIRAIHCVIIVMILAVPLIFIEELKTGLGDIIIDFEIDIRALKEYGMILIVLLSLIYSFSTWHFSKAYKVLPLMLFIVFIVVMNSIRVPSSILICGFRWILPLFLPVFLYGFIDEKFMKKCYKATSLIFLIHLSVQIAELFVMPPYNGTTYWGLSARVPGLVSHAHAAAYFTCFYYLLIVGFEDKQRRQLIGTSAVVFSLLLAASSTGIIVFSILFLMNKFKESRYWNITLLLLPFILIATLMNADKITNREEGSSESSITTRMGFFETIFTHSSFISHDFGYSTNGAFIISEKTNVKIKDYLYADSFYNTLFGNLGMAISFSILIMVIVLIVKLVKKKQVVPLMFLIFYLLFSTTEIITEVYPGSLFLPIVVAYFFYNKKLYVKKD